MQDPFIYSLRLLILIIHLQYFEDLKTKYRACTFQLLYLMLSEWSLFEEHAINLFYQKCQYRTNRLEHENFSNIDTLQICEFWTSYKNYARSMWPLSVHVTCGWLREFCAKKCEAIAIILQHCTCLACRQICEAFVVYQSIKWICTMCSGAVILWTLWDIKFVFQCYKIELQCPLLVKITLNDLDWNSGKCWWKIDRIVVMLC